MRKIFMHGVIAGALSAIAGIIYFGIYQNTLETAFNKVVNVGSIAGLCMLGCVMISTGYMLLEKFNRQNLAGWLNVLIAVLSFASIIIPVSISLPLDVKNPELFPGLVVPMHFFPALAYFCLSPFFKG